MFEVRVEGEFVAQHHVRMPDGALETPHSHHWRIVAYFRRKELDDVGMVVDFVAAEAALGEVLRMLHESDLNKNPALGGANPTAEIVAQFVLDRLRNTGWRTVYKVEVTEAPGCVAAYTREDM